MTFGAMMRAIEQRRGVPAVDKAIAFERQEESMAALERGARFDRICNEH